MRRKTNAAFKGYRTTDRMWEATEELLFYCLAHPQESLRCAPAPVINSRRPLGYTPWAQRGKRNCCDRTECGIGTARFRHTIFKLSEGVDGSNENSQLD